MNPDFAFQDDYLLSLADTITADVSVSNAALQIVPIDEFSGDSVYPPSPPNVVLTDSQLTGVTGATIHFRNLTDYVNSSGASDFFLQPGLDLQLPVNPNTSTVVQNTPSGVTTLIHTIPVLSPLTIGPLTVLGTTARLMARRV